MRRAGLLYCVGIDKTRFYALGRHDNLPFYLEGAAMQKWQEFSLDDAFRLRLLIDMAGGEGEDLKHAGYPPSYCEKIISNALASLHVNEVSLDEASAHWAGVAIFEDASPHADDEPLRYSRWFLGKLCEIPAWVEELSSREGDRPIRLFLGNATQAARVVRNRAFDLGLPEALDSGDSI